MADIAHTKTDQKLEEMEKRLSAIYSRAEKEIGERWKEYLVEAQAEIDELQKEYEIAKKGGDEKEIRKAGKKLSKAKRERTLMDKRFKDLTETTAKQFANVNKTALAYVNGQLPEVYSINYNALEKSVDGVGGYSFSLVDADTVKNLATTDKSLLPYKQLDEKTDVRWNVKKMNAEVLQGILQGEPMDKIANRLSKVTGMNETAAIRNARTMVTGAENKGRQDSYARATADGIILQKEWISTNDSRTRHSHAVLDGAIVDQDKKFGNGLMFPGDPSGRPEETWNCRCTVAAVVKGFKKVQVQRAMDEKDEYTQAEQDEFAALQKKYKNKTQVMLFGTEEEMVRYDYLLQKDKANAGTFDYYKRFQHQSIAESRMNGWRVEPTTAERDAISSYSRSGYLKMNENLRFGNYAPDSVKREISALHGFLDKCETQDELYLSRGVTKPALDKMFGGDGWRKNSSSLVGSVFKDKGFVSTTPYQGGGFGGDVVMYIKAPKGTKGAYIKDFAASSEEKEFLIQSDTSFVVRNIVEEVDKWGDKKYKVFAEVIV